MSNPEEIRRDIERTRAELSDNVNALGDSTSPGNIARGQVDRVKEGASNLRDRVFGAPEDPYDDGVAGGVGAAVDDAREAAADMPGKLRSSTRGNPLAAGLIALGVGALIGGLIPSSQRERDIAHQVKEAAEPLVDQAKEMAMEAKDKLQPLAQEAAQSVGDAAKEAGEAVKEDAADAKDKVADKAASSAQTVKGDASDAVDDTKRDAQQASAQQRPDRPSPSGWQGGAESRPGTLS